MANKQKHDDQTSDPRTGRKPKTRIEREENEDLEVDETSQATEGNPEIPQNTGAQPQVVQRQRRLDDPVGEDEVEPEAIDEQMRNQDA